MTWVRFTDGFRYSDTRYTQYFSAGDHLNVPRKVADLAVYKGKAVKEVKKREKERED